MESQQNEYFYCYSLRLYHFICAFGGRCEGSSINHVSNSRYWTFFKSEELDRVIELYNSVKHKYNLKKFDH